MMLPVYAWSAAPGADVLSDFLRRHPHARRLVFGLDGHSLPDWHAPGCAAAGSLHRRLAAARELIQFSGCNYLPDLICGKELWLLPPHEMAQLAAYFGTAPLLWQDTPLPQNALPPDQPWLTPPPASASGRVLVIGAGIAGAATAYELARRGIRVCVLEAADRPAQAASGSRQGLLYAKISAHPTAQTELLLSGYGYTRRLLERLLPGREAWDAPGVLHLDHNEAESRRNRELAAQTRHRHLYYGVGAAEAAGLCGLHAGTGGLFWPQGAWLNPAALIGAMLSHPLIETRCGHAVSGLAYEGGQWHAQAAGQTFSGSHIVFCCGAGSRLIPLLQGFPFAAIRGQTSLAHAVSGSLKLRAALSGAAYIAPAWQGVHTFGATFRPKDDDSGWRGSDEAENRRSLLYLSPELAEAFAPQWAGDGSGSLKGHAAVRCDTFDHLPAVGALGDAAAMRDTYAGLAHDKNRRISTPCPYLPNAYVNTAHGSRGLATAPVCAAQLAAEICAAPSVLSPRLRRALHPNRLVIRQIVRPDTHAGAAAEAR